jgi:para-aminobenzoate synthetase component I
MFNKGIIFQGNTRSDWLDISASNPVDIISLSLDDPSKNLVEFVQDNIGKFIAGFISYEYGVNILGVSIKEPKPIPAVHFRAYDAYENYQSVTPENDFVKWAPFEPRISESEYASNFNKIIRHIRSGDIYQLNYTHPLVSQTNADPISLFNAMREKNEVGYSAFIEDDDWAIHSLSPEQFIVIENGVISTKPIKGTIPRGSTSNEDEQNLNQLLTNEKEQAELYMIIDLLRNDLGKVCQTGSVRVLESKSIQKLEEVFHTYGVVQGTLKNEIHPIEALLSMSPGGSISGCPKKRACELISELETSPRGVYTGTIGYILPNGSLHFNIAIRTITQIEEKLILGVGGGITIGSNCEDEFNESLVKAASFQK